MELKLLFLQVHSLSYELSDNEIKDLSNIFDKLINCPDFLLSQDSMTEPFEEVELLE